MKKETAKRKGVKIFWIPATVFGVYLFPIGFIWCVINTVKEAACFRERNRKILFCGLGAMAFSVFEYVYSTVIIRFERDNKLLYVLFGLGFVLGLYLTAVYLLLARRADRLNGIYTLVEKQHITSVVQMSEITGWAQDNVKKYILKLIALGDLPNARLEGDRLILTESIWADQRVICSSCGAELNVNLGQTLVCEYCGGALDFSNKKRKEEHTL